MKKLSLILILFCSHFAFSQDYYQYFEGNNNNLEVILLPDDSTNSWQIGEPNKTLFDTAATTPNVIITKLDTSYPTNDTSIFIITDFNRWQDYGIYALQWMQKLDVDTNDICMVEFSTDSMNWQNIFDNPFVYNLYGFDSINVDTLKFNDSTTEDIVGFTGMDTTWKNIWLCFDGSYYWEYSNFYIKYTFISDLTETKQEGWMIDNILAHQTYVHTVDEQQEEYLKVYPTITDNRIHIQTKKLKEYHIIEQIDVINSQGRVVNTFGKAPTKFFIDIGDLEKGNYFIKVKTNKKTETHRVVLR